MILRLFFITVVLFIAGCATQGVNTINWEQGEPMKVVNDVTVNKPYSQVWDNLVKELSKSFYVINNIDKESRIINLSFSTNTPNNFVDCGTTHRTYKQCEKIEKFDYDVAETAQFKYATDKQLHPSLAYYFIVRREPTMEGRTNIYIAPDEINKEITSVTVNTRYIITTKIMGEVVAEHANGNIVQRQRVPDETTTVSFNTNQVGELALKDGDKLTCFSKGKLESDILSMASK